MGHFLSGAERVKNYVNVHLHCIVSSLYRLCLPVENFLRTHMPLLFVLIITSALYCAINNHFGVIRVPFVATSRLAPRCMCDSPQRSVREDLRPHTCGANKRRLKPIFMLCMQWRIFRVFKVFS